MKTTTKTTNYIDTKHYLLDNTITNCLLNSNEMKINHTAANNGSQLGRVAKLNNKNFYLIALRVLDRKNRILVYGYIPYNISYINIFLAYMLGRNRLITDSREPERHLTVLDKSIISRLLNSCSDDPLFYSRKDVTRHISSLISLNNDKSISSIEYATNIIRIINLSLCIFNLKGMSEILDFAFNNNYKAIARKILVNVKGCGHEDGEDVKWSTGFVDSTIFVVEDSNIQEFILNIRNKGYDISYGPQSSRGCVNSINNTLILLDKDFRNSMCLHNKYHYEMKRCLKIPRINFSFENVHRNLGGIRF